MRALLGIDIGTSAVKAAVFDLDGTLIDRQGAEYPILRPRSGWCEQNPETWYEAVCGALRMMFVRGRVRSGEIAGVGIAGQSWAAVPVDANGQALANTPLWMDTRAEGICQELRQRISDARILQVSGNQLRPSYCVPKLIWFKQHMPEIYQQARYFLQSNGYILQRLTGVINQDLSQGYGYAFFNMHEGTWDTALCEQFGVDADKLPPITPCHQVVGVVTARAAQESGLMAGTPVVAGGLDAACATLGVGVVDDGQVQEQGGQAGGMSICTREYVAHPKLILSRHVVPERFLLQGGTVGGGGALRWFAQQMGISERQQAERTGRSVYEVLSDEAGQVDPGSGGVIFLPYMAGERSPIWNPDARGMFFGINYDSTKEQMARAVMEGSAFALRHNLETAQEAGAHCAILRAMGGAAASEVWTQIKADVTGCTLEVPATNEATAWGAAILAGVGIGAMPDCQSAVRGNTAIRRVYRPNANNRGRYDRLYSIYRELYERTKDLMAVLPRQEEEGDRA